MNPSTHPEVFSTYDIGRLTGTDPTTIHKWIDKGMLRGYRTPGGHRRVRAEDLRAFLIFQKMPVPEELGGSDAWRVMVVGRRGAVLRAGYELQRLRPAWKIVRAEDGVLALLQIPRFLPDVIAFDLGMSGVDPLEAVKGLQGRAETAGIKLLGLSEKCGTGIAKKALATGIHACLERPFSAQKLATAIESVMGVQPLRELGGSIDLRLFP